MSRKTPGRSLQRLAEDEMGVRPKLTLCHTIMRDIVRNPLITMEEQLAAAFEANRERLEESAHAQYLEKS